MKKHFVRIWIALGAVLALLMLIAPPASAQTAAKQPFFIPYGQWLDLGNGPMELLPVGGNGVAYTAGGTGVGSTSGASTTLTLTATPAVPPCVGCVITGTGIAAGTTVAAFNGTTTVTLSAAMTVAASTPLAWGAACPTSGAQTPGTSNLSAPLELRATGAASPLAYPFYTYARVCINVPGNTQAGLTILQFPIGAW